ncbi:MAG: FAD-dependent oxidoreductase [Proteobacteria bacterium]|nr:FAD-dependent oxidoreductase [Pseudomonadota bacterium]
MDQVTQPDARYRVLFDPVQIGPVIARNRFYQVPHCTGMGYSLPRTLAAMRGMKAAGGWGVVCTEYCSIHPTSDDLPHPFASLWDEGDTRNLAALAEAVHEHGSLAGVELWHGGSYVANLGSRQPTLGVRSMPSHGEPVQSQPMDRRDIRELRRWHVEAARRARAAGFDIVYVYPAHGYLLWEFLSRSLNGRSDEYGGSLENRTRLLRELLQETREAVGDKCAVATRFSADGHGEEHLSGSEARDVIGALAELPDLWDLVVSDYYGQEMATSRFVPEASLEEKVRYVKALTTKPVVSVGRFTSPDTMVRQVRSGVMDLVGAARPSIADPFLPEKIRTGRLEDIRECIGCNVCYAYNYRGAAIRCTQNPTMGEEWRRGWHPEQVPPGSGSVLIVGAGPAGLEAAHILGKRGFRVSVAEARNAAGGRVTLEARLPGLSEWGRVRDYRLGQLRGLANVTVYFESKLTASDVREFGADHVLIATGAHWRRDATGRSRAQPLAFPAAKVLTPDDILAGARPGGSVVVYDDDNYYMGPSIAVLLARNGARVSYVTTASTAGEWSHYTGEQQRVQEQLIEVGVEILVSRLIAAYDGTTIVLDGAYGGPSRTLEASSVVLVTSREPDEALYRQLCDTAGTDAPAGIQRIGDCRQPGIIAHAVYAGHRAARELDVVMPATSRDRPTI